jgi:hypothetical protein
LAWMVLALGLLGYPKARWWRARQGEVS